MRTIKARLFPIMIIAALGLTILWWKTNLGASPTLTPFRETGDLYVVESFSGAIYRVIEGTDGPVLEETVTAGQITQVTGVAGPRFENSGVAFDPAGNLYFTEQESKSILMLRGDGTLEQLVTQDEIAALNGSSPPEADPEGLAFGSDGSLYIIDDQEEAILRMNPVDDSLHLYVTRHQIQEAIGPDATVVLDTAIAGAEEDVLYVASSGDPTAIVRIKDTDSSNPEITRLAGDFDFQNLEGYMTRAADGSIIVADTPPGQEGEPTQHVLYRVSPDGDVRVFLGPDQIRAANGRDDSADVTLTAGFAFDSHGNFFLAQSGTDDLLWFPPNRNNGRLYLVEATFKQRAGRDDMELNGGIALEPAGEALISESGILSLLN